MRAGLRLLALSLLSVVWLGGCSLLHPHRITNPNLPPGYKAQQKAARKAQKASIKAAKDEDKARRKRKDKDEDTADNSADAASGGSAPTEAAPASNQAKSTLPDKSTVKYDKNGLMKKPKLLRRRYYKPAPKPFRPWHSISTFFKNLTHRHGHGKPKSAPGSAPGSSDKSVKAAPAAPAPTNTGLTP